MFAVATILLIISGPVLFPAIVTAFHAIAGARQRSRETVARRISRPHVRPTAFTRPIRAT
jgi:hypothetical protein